MLVPLQALRRARGLEFTTCAFVRGVVTPLFDVVRICAMKVRVVGVSRPARLANSTEPHAHSPFSDITQTALDFCPDANNRLIRFVNEFGS